MRRSLIRQTIKSGKGFVVPRRWIAVTVWTGSFPPPAVVPAPMAQVGAAVPVAFRSSRGAASGSRNSVFVGEGPPGAFTLTGEFYPPSTLQAFRIGQSILSFVMLFALVAATFVLFGREEGAGTPPMYGVLMVIVFASAIGLVIWKRVLVNSAESATLVVRATEIRRVRSTVNYSMLAWWLLIGPFALIPLFAGRRRLRMELPVSVDGRVGTLPLILLEQRRGDAEVMVSRLRAAGAR